MVLAFPNYHRALWYLAIAAHHYLYPNPHMVPSYGASCYLLTTPLQVELHPFNQQPQLLRYATEQVSGKLVAG